MNVELMTPPLLSRFPASQHPPYQANGTPAAGRRAVTYVVVIFPDETKASRPGRVGEAVARWRPMSSSTWRAAGLRELRQRGRDATPEPLRLVMAELQIAGIRRQVTLSLATDFETERTTSN
jgi:hypothetical protein